MTKDANILCSFCGRDKTQVRRIFKSEAANICSECVENCVTEGGHLDAQAAAEQKQSAPALDPKVAIEQALDAVAELPSPRRIKEHLDLTVIGQDEAKTVLSVAVHNHYKRLAHDAVLDDIGLDKSNILIAGPTGVGKTELARSLAKVLDVPFAIVDATSLTASGYVGDDVETIISRLLDAADGDVERAERGIIYVDEIDKIAAKGENMSITRDVSGEDVQNALLKIIEGTVASIPMKGNNRKHPEAATMMVDTSRILFIAGGAFAGLSGIIADRMDAKSVGFGASVGTGEKPIEGDMLVHVEPEDLMRYGMKAEFLGRFPILASLEPLTVGMLGRILTEPKNAIITQFHRMFDLECVELKFTPESVDAIAKRAIARKIGARGLRSIIEKILLKDMYDLPELNDVASIVVEPDGTWFKTRRVLRSIVKRKAA